ncbi:MAG TPA: single-stranded-DNA-specific exonuclease RecJ [Acidobacteriaceae bacterium]
MSTAPCAQQGTSAPARSPVQSPGYAQWLLPPVDPSAVNALAQAVGVPLPVASLLLQRGVSDAAAAAQFLHPTLDHLLDPYCLHGMAAAVARIQQAIAAREPILIYGDYDVDGTTAIVLLKTAIEILGGTFRYHIPHRLRDGYGMQAEVLTRAAAEGVCLVISVDTGIRAFAAADEAARLSLDLIVTDHHLPEAAMGLPKALAVLNPNQPDCAYPCKHLCGAGVAFKLAQALLEAPAAFPRVDPQRAREKLLPSFLKMLVLATVADAVPLLGENRVIASLGIDGLRRPVNAGLRALLAVAQLDPAKRALTATDIGFRIGPRINAAGRMDIASEVVELFTTRDPERARELALKLDQLNTDRRAAEAAVLAQIDATLTAGTIDRQGCLVIDGDGWHRGVLGILASRVVERTGRPALVLSHEDGEAHGSGRSIPGFHLLEALESCHDVFVRFGGHAHAVGFSLTSARVPELRDRLQQHSTVKLTPQILERKLDCSAELPLREIDLPLYHSLRLLEPYGMGNEEPVFIARNLTLETPPQTMKEEHIRMHVRDDQTVMKALGWRWAERVRSLALDQGSRIDLAYRLRMNEHPDFGGLELEIVDLLPK